MPVNIQPEDGGSYEYITKNAVMRCDRGTVPTQLRPFPKTVKIGSKLPATNSDKIPLINNFDFGICTLTQKPCKLNIVLLMWEDVKKDFNIQGDSPLLDKSTIKCALSGTISFLTSGQ